MKLKYVKRISMQVDGFISFLVPVKNEKVGECMNELWNLYDRLYYIYGNKINNSYVDSIIREAVNKTLPGAYQKTIAAASMEEWERVWLNKMYSLYDEILFLWELNSIIPNNETITHEQLTEIIKREKDIERLMKFIIYTVEVFAEGGLIQKECEECYKFFLARVKIFDEKIG